MFLDNIMYLQSKYLLRIFTVEGIFDTHEVNQEVPLPKTELKQ